MSDEPLSGELARDDRADRLSFVVYGTIAVLAGVGGLTLESQALDALQAGAVFIVIAVSSWMAHTMWRVVRARARRDPEGERSHEVRELLTSWPIVASGLPAAAVMVLAAAGVWSVSTGLTLAQGLGIFVLFAAGLVTARLAGETGPRKLVYVLALPSVGLAIVALEVAAHHV